MKQFPINPANTMQVVIVNVIEMISYEYFIGKSTAVSFHTL